MKTRRSFAITWIEMEKLGVRLLCKRLGEEGFDVVLTPDMKTIVPRWERDHFWWTDQQTTRYFHFDKEEDPPRLRAELRGGQAEKPKHKAKPDASKYIKEEPEERSFQFDEDI